MRIPRLYQPSGLTSGSEIQLIDTAARHAISVLRLRTGDAVELFDGAGDVCEGEIVAIRKHMVTVAIGEVRQQSRESNLAVTLAMGIAKGERMDFAIQKSVELGVHQFQPLLTERTVVRLNTQRAQRRFDHWRAVSISACEQSGRNHLPALAPVAPLSQWLGQWCPSDSLGVMPTPGACTGLRSVPPPPNATVTVLIGPEGGLSLAERESAIACGFTPVHLGARVLRTETAALSALAAMMTLWGDMG